MNIDGNLSAIISFIDQSEVGDTYFNKKKNDPEAHPLLKAKNLEEWVALSQQYPNDDVDKYASIFHMNQKALIKKLFKEAVAKESSLAQQFQDILTLPQTEVARKKTDLEHVRKICCECYSLVPSTTQKVMQFFDSPYVKTLLVGSLYIMRSPLAKLVGPYKEWAVIKLSASQFGQTVLKILTFQSWWSFGLFLGGAVMSLAPRPLPTVGMTIAHYLKGRTVIESLYEKPLFYAIWGATFILTPQEEFWVKEAAKCVAHDISKLPKTNPPKDKIVIEHGELVDLSFMDLP